MRPGDYISPCMMSSNYWKKDTSRALQGAKIRTIDSAKQDGRSMCEMEDFT